MLARIKCMPNLTAYTGTHVTATDTVTLQANKDIEITGSQVTGDKVAVNTGSNLSITSLQEQDNYKERTKSGGFSIIQVCYRASWSICR